MFLTPTEVATIYYEGEADPMMSDRQFRMRNAWDQLERYGGEVFDDALCDLLEAITDINDDLWHDRHPDCVCESIDKAIAILQGMRPIR